MIISCVDKYFKPQKKFFPALLCCLHRIAGRDSKMCSKMQKYDLFIPNMQEFSYKMRKIITQHYIYILKNSEYTGIHN